MAKKWTVLLENEGLMNSLTIWNHFLVPVDFGFEPEPEPGPEPEPEPEPELVSAILKKPPMLTSYT